MMRNRSELAGMLPPKLGACGAQVVQESAGAGRLTLSSPSMVSSTRASMQSLPT